MGFSACCGAFLRRGRKPGKTGKTEMVSKYGSLVVSRCVDGFDLGGTLSSSASPLGGNSWFLGTGRRKESIARVFLRAGSGKFTVNGRTPDQYFPNHAWKHDATEPP